MSSVSASFAQRKNNVKEIKPVIGPAGNWEGYYILNIDPLHCSVFNVNLAGLLSYPRDIHDRMNAECKILSYEDVPVYFFVIHIDPSVAAKYPGLEFKLNFKAGADTDSEACVDVYPNDTNNVPGDTNAVSYSVDLLSPVNGFNSFDTQSLLLHSNGKKFTVISSGPVSWSSFFDY